MKIVIVGKDEGLKVAGIGVFTKRLRKFLDDQGDEVYELRFSKKRFSDKNTFAIPYLVAEKRTFVLLPTLKTLGVIRSKLSKIKPDIVYLNIGTSTLDFALPSLCHKLGIPIAAVWHGDFANSSKRFKIVTRLPFLAYVPFCKSLDLLHVFSKNLSSFYVRKGVAREKILILPNGVDTRIYSPGSSRFAEKHNVEKGVLFLGRLTLVKNPEVVLRSFLKLDLPQSYKLVLVGYGELQKQLEQKYRDERIIFTGLVTNEEKKVDIIRSCQIFVLPSKYEGMSLSLLEAMACGLACVASDVGTNKQLVNGAGVIIPQKELGRRLPRILGSLLENPDKVAEMARKARARVVENYYEQRVFGKLREALLETAEINGRLLG